MGTFPGISRALLLSVLVHAFWLWPRPLPESAQRSALLVRLRAPSTDAATLAAPASPAEVRPKLPPAPVRRPLSAVSGIPAGTASISTSSVDVPTLALPATANGLDAAGVRAYRVALATELRRAGFFAQGLRSGMHGRIELAVSLSAQSQVLAVEVVHSSGNLALDQHALLALGEIAHRTAPPAVLQGQAFRLVLQLEVD